MCKICLLKVKENPLMLALVTHQTPEICLAAIKSDDNTSRFIRNPNLKNRLKAIKKKHDNTTRSIITPDIVRANPDKPWDWSGISSNPSITWDIIQANPDKPWDWSGISSNPSRPRHHSSTSYLR
jgi:hypothetical protein